METIECTISFEAQRTEGKLSRTQVLLRMLDQLLPKYNLNGLPQLNISTSPDHPTLSSIEQNFGHFTTTNFLGAGIAIARSDVFAPFRLAQTAEDTITKIQTGRTQSLAHPYDSISHLLRFQRQFPQFAYPKITAAVRLDGELIGYQMPTHHAPFLLFNALTKDHQELLTSSIPPLYLDKNGRNFVVIDSNPMVTDVLPPY